MRRIHISSGTTFGNWTVMGDAPARQNKEARYWCVCKCGITKNQSSTLLRSGRSLGCPKCATRAGGKVKHGACFTPTYRSWAQMKSRCLLPTHHAYASYGGRGVTICGRWKESFPNFLSDMGERPVGRTLDRINNDGNYEPGNCRWATHSEQQKNKRRFNQYDGYRLHRVG